MIQVVEWLWWWWHLHAVYLLFFTSCFGLHGIITFFLTTVLYCWISIKTHFHLPCVLMMMKTYTNLHFFRFQTAISSWTRLWLTQKTNLMIFSCSYINCIYMYISWCDLLWKMNTLCHKKCIQSLQICSVLTQIC